jgi:hypothetical protein
MLGDEETDIRTSSGLTGAVEKVSYAARCTGAAPHPSSLSLESRPDAKRLRDQQYCGFGALPNPSISAWPSDGFARFKVGSARVFNEALGFPALA